MKESFRINIRLQPFLFITAALFLPSIGGIAEMFTLPFESLHIVHVVCVLMWVLGFIWLYKALTQKISVDQNCIVHKGIFFTKEHNIVNLEDIGESDIPKKDTKMFASHIRFLRIRSKNCKSLIRSDIVPKYNDLKKKIEKIIGKELELTIHKKSTLFRILDWGA